MEKEKILYYFGNSIKHTIYASTSKYLFKEKGDSFGVIDEFYNKAYTKNEINKIIFELLEKEPYILGSMNLEISIMEKDLKRESNTCYQVLRFKNHTAKQERLNEEHHEKNQIIKYRKKINMQMTKNNIQIEKETPLNKIVENYEQFLESVPAKEETEEVLEEFPKVKNSSYKLR